MRFGRIRRTGLALVIYYGMVQFVLSRLCVHYFEIVAHPSGLPCRYIIDCCGAAFLVRAPGLGLIQHDLCCSPVPDVFDLERHPDRLPGFCNVHVKRSRNLELWYGGFIGIVFGTGSGFFSIVRLNRVIISHPPFRRSGDPDGYGIAIHTERIDVYACSALCFVCGGTITHKYRDHSRRHLVTRYTKLRRVD